MVGHKLDDAEPLSCAQLVKELNLPHGVIMLALGWLAREDKLQIQETNRGHVVSLCRPNLRKMIPSRPHFRTIKNYWYSRTQYQRMALRWFGVPRRISHLIDVNF